MCLYIVLCKIVQGLGHPEAAFGHIKDVCASLTCFYLQQFTAESPNVVKCGGSPQKFIL